jgi:CRP/FNR family transcriptional regulator, cyclic AMP receptor protein
MKPATKRARNLADRPEWPRQIESKSNRARGRGNASFDACSFLEKDGVVRKIVEYARKATIFAQGAPARSVLCIREGGVKLSVVNGIGKEAVVAMLGPGDFLGEGALAGQTIRIGMATAITPTTVVEVDKSEMMRLLHSDHEFSDGFISYMLTRNIRIEADLVDQLFNSTEKRLARALLLLAQYGKDDAHQRILPKVSQETLAETIGTTRSRVNLFMNKFKKMGFIKYNGGLQVNSSLLSVVLHE